MKTSIEIPTFLMQETREKSKATTNRKAVIIAMTEYVRREKLKEAVNLLGTFTGLPSVAELQKSRRKR